MSQFDFGLPTPNIVRYVDRTLYRKKSVVPQFDFYIVRYVGWTLYRRIWVVSQFDFAQPRDWDIIHVEKLGA